MATIKTYALSAWDAQQTISRKMGYDLAHADIAIRAVALSTCVIFGVVLRIFFNKGLATDAEMNAVLQNALSADYPLLQPVPPPTGDGSNVVPPPDLGA
jgi:hypothetical protein